MEKLTFTIRQISGGWVIGDSNPIGPFFCKNRALELAIGMAEAITRSGGDACVVIEGEATP